MMTEADRAVLDESYRNTRMGREAINVVIGNVEDDDLALQGLSRFLLCGAGGDGQGEHHRKRHQQGQEFLSLHSFTSSFF